MWSRSCPAHADLLESRGVWRLGAAAVTAAGMALALCAAPGQAAPGASDGSGAAATDVGEVTPQAVGSGEVTPQAVGPVGRSKVRWRACPVEDAPTRQCARVKVPKVYGKPTAGRIQVAIARIPATGSRKQRIGSLLWDAGGPGGPSTEMIGMMAARMSPRVRAHFDFVAFDPRGIGASRPALAECRGPWPVLPARDDDPNWSRAQQKSATVLRADNRACLRSARRFAATMGTNNVARDLNRIRKALGDDELTFWGTSYGTRIGYVYATMYPRRVRAMVLDGNIDPTGDFAGLPEIGGTSEDLALRFMKRHDADSHRAIMRTLRKLTSDPVRLDDGTRYSRWDWLNLVGGFMAFQNTWPQLPRVARAVSVARGSGPKAEAARGDLAAWKVLPNSNEGGGFSIVNCLDYADRLSAREQATIARDVDRGYPVFGGSLALQYAMGCVGLGRLEPDPIPTIETAAERARVADVPVLLANATHDGSTPMAWAKRMQQAFDRPMIKYRSGQHVIWGAVRSRCVNKPIDDFVIRLREPKRGRTCPFVPPEPTTQPTSEVLAGLR